MKIIGVAVKRHALEGGHRVNPIAGMKLAEIGAPQLGAKRHLAVQSTTKQPELQPDFILDRRFRPQRRIAKCRAADVRRNPAERERQRRAAVLLLAVVRACRRRVVVPGRQRVLRSVVTNLAFDTRILP